MISNEQHNKKLGITWELTPIYQYSVIVSDDETGEVRMYWNDCDKTYYETCIADEKHCRVLYAETAVNLRT
ncbi:hypothetical protein OI69_12285 [Pectobacterium fontis]|uniref:Uncharacterized protein n=1 Tax=Pectobacterium fontis TaxID=2558042 RepID=A0A7V8IJK1_9GAMM|nr:hypothetical protein OI69_12285 [Pectobacterium fontis]